MHTGRILLNRHRRRTQLRRVGLVVLVGLLAYLLWTGEETETPEARLTSLPTAAPTIAVRIGGSSPSVAVAGAWTAYALDGPRAARGAELQTGTSLRPTKPVVDGGSLHVGPVTVGADDWVELVPSADGALQVDGPRAYRGTLRVGVVDGRVYAVNVLPIEGYLQGVLGAEMPLSWRDAALESQAIAARTYALYERNHAAKGKAWDVRDTVASQVYKGVLAEHARAREVIEATRGAVLTWKGAPIKAFFHSTCGGRTADGESVFGDEHAIGPLTGRPCEHCDHSPAHRWTRKLSGSDLERKLRRAGLRPGHVRRIQVQTVRGRANKVRLVGSKKAVVLSGTRLRSVVGVGRDGLQSTAFEVRRDGKRFVFRGSGWGHGVGMCQWGAGGMAKAGWATQDILAHYYPGAMLVRLWE